MTQTRSKYTTWPLPKKVPAASIGVIFHKPRAGPVAFPRVPYWHLCSQTSVSWAITASLALFFRCSPFLCRLPSSLHEPGENLEWTPRSVLSPPELCQCLPGCRSDPDPLLPLWHGEEEDAGEELCLGGPCLVCGWVTTAKNTDWARPGSKMLMTAHTNPLQSPTPWHFCCNFRAMGMNPCRLPIPTLCSLRSTEK